MDGSDASSFLNVGVIFACFQISGTLPDDPEKLNSSHNGEERGRLSSFKIRLLIWSGPIAFPVFNDFKTFSTSTGVKLRVSKVGTSSCTILGSVAVVSFRLFCLLKCSLRIPTFSFSSEYIIFSLHRGVITELEQGFINCFSVFHQSLGPNSLLLSFSAILSVCIFFRFSDCVCYLISIMFIVFVYGFSTFIFVVQTLSFSHHFLIELVSQFGSDCLTFIKKVSEKFIPNKILGMNCSETFLYAQLYFWRKCLYYYFSIDSS